ncbi:MAG: hypothetical protein HY720_25455 [Planctomycetes bacterium]|nr:hypothetical protein [Planctomycetota bacterium]
MVIVGAVAGVVAVAVLGGGIYYFAIREDAGPTPGGPAKNSGKSKTGGLSEKDFAYELGKIDEAIAEDRYNDAADRGKKLALRVSGKAEWEAEIARRMERAKELPRFWEALLAAVNGRGKFTCPEGSWKKYEIQSASAEGLSVIRSGKTDATLLRWQSIEFASKKSMYQLVVFLGLETSEPFATLHYVIHRHADEAIQRQAAKAISLAPERREEVLSLVAAAFGMADPGLLVVTADRVLTPEQKAELDASGGSSGTNGEESPDGTDPGAEDHEGKVQYEGRWVTPEEKEELEESAMRAKGLVRHGNRWVTPEEKARLEREVDHEGLVEYQGRWVTPEEKERMENEAKGLVLHDGRWMTPAEKARLERAENEAKGLVLHEGKWITREEKEALEKKEEMEKKGYVYFRGRWISVAERSMLEDIIEGTPAEEDYHSTPGFALRIALPDSEKWSYQANGGAPLGGGSAIAAIQKSDGGGALVAMRLSAFVFATRYIFAGRGWEEEIKGDNPSGLLRLHRQIYEDRPGASVRTKMEKDFFSKDMHAFWCHLDYPDGSVVKIYSVASNLRNADKGFVWVVEFAPGQFQVSAIGVDSILKTFEATDKGR